MLFFTVICDTYLQTHQVQQVFECTWQHSKLSSEPAACSPVADRVPVYGTLKVLLAV